MIDQLVPRRRRLRHAAAVLAGAGVIAALCGSATAGAAGSTTTSPPASASAWKGIVTAANKEKKLEVWSVLNSAHNADVKTAFEKEYPNIKVTFTTFSPPDIDTRVDAEQSAKVGTVDVLLSTDRIWHQKHLKYFKKQVGPDIAAADTLLRKGAAPSPGGAPVSTQVLYDDNTRALNALGPWGYAWNWDAVPNRRAPSFESLFKDDKYKGRIGIIDPANSPINVVVDGIFRQRYPRLFERLSELHPTIYAKAGPMGEALAAGAIDVALGIAPGAVTGKGNLGFGFDEKGPAPSTPVYTEVLASSKRPNAAQVFANWLLTRKGQKAWASGYASVLPNIVGSTISASNTMVFDAEGQDPAETKKTKDALNKALGR